jgi:hypothetical protein
MHKRTWLMTLLVLFLIATLTCWADMSFAQGRGGQGRGGAAQGAGTGWGAAANAGCPYYSGAQACPRYGGGNPQTRKRQRIRQSAPQSQANPQTNPQTQTQNPPNQSGN